MVRNSEITLEEIFKEGRINLENDDFNCLICSLPLFDGLQCKRGHGACKSCWERIIGTGGKKECHLCRIQIKSFDDLSKNLYLEKEISKQKVSCLNNGKEKFGNTLVVKSDGGCKRQDIPIENLLYHIKNECGYLLIDCKHSKDCKYYKHIPLEQHQNECQYISIHCPGLCGKKDSRMNIIKHLETPNACKPLIKDNGGNNNNYNNNENINLIIERTYQNQIKAIKENAESEISRLKSQLSLSNLRIADLADEIEELRASFLRMESKFDILEESTTGRSGTIIINGWRMKLKSMCYGEAVARETFYIGKNNYCIRVYPMGNCYKNRGFVSVELGRFDNEESHLDIDFRAEIKDYNIRQKVQLCYSPGDTEHGINQLVPVDQIEKEFRIILHFKVDIKPKIKN
ncbi:hypothetical protein ACTA71_003228 [Dictyostelium dimigraforme]